MIGRKTLLALIAAITLLPAASWALSRAMVYTPPQVLVSQSDLIVVVKVVKIGEPVEMKLTLPGQTKVYNGYFRTCTVEVAKTLYNNLGKDKKVPETIKVIMMAPSQQKQGKQPVQPVPQGQIRPGGRGVPIKLPKPGKRAQLQQKNVPAPRPLPRIAPIFRLYPTLVADRSYIMSLKQLPGKDSLFLNSNPGNWVKSTPEGIKEFEKYTDVEKWAWGGKCKAGLQLAIIINNPQITTNKGSAYLPTMAAVRNTSDKTVLLDLHPREKAFDIILMNAAGDTSSPEDMYRPYQHFDKTRRMIHKLEPGKIVFLGMSGTNTSLSARMKVAKGKWELYLAYTIKGKGKKDVSDPDRWSGELRSSGIDVEVTEAKVSPPRRIRPIRGLLIKRK